MGINPGLGPIKCTTAHEDGKRLGNIYQSARNKELTHDRELAKQKKRSEELAS